MRKNRLIALIGTLTMAAAGLTAVSAGVSNKKAESVDAADGITDIFFYMQYDAGNWDGYPKWNSNGVVWTHVWDDKGNSEDLELSKTTVSESTSTSVSNTTVYHVDLSSLSFTPKTLLFANGSAKGEYWRQTGNLSIGSINSFYLNSEGNAGVTTSNIYSVKVSSNGNGTTTSSAPYVKAGCNVNLSAVPNDGYKFRTWSDTDTNKNRTYWNINNNLNLTATYTELSISNGYWIEFSEPGSGHAIREKLTWNGSEGASSNHNIEDLHLDVGDSFKVVKYEDEQIKNYFGTDKADNKDGAAIKEGQLYANDSQDYVVRVEGDYDIYFNDQYDWEASNLVWIPANSYTVVYDNNGGSGTVGGQTAYFYDDSTETGRSFAENVYGKTTFTAPDSTKIFDGWSTNKNATQGDLKPGDMQATADKVPNPTSGNSVTLYAIWRDKNPADGYYVKIFTDGHQANIPMALKDGSTTEYVANVDLAENDEFKVVYYQDEVISESTGYHGYTELKSGDGSAKESNELTGTDNIVASKAGNYQIYFETGSTNPGIWAPNLIDVTFNANGHGTAPSALVVRNGNPITDPGEITGVDGWVFTGWYEDQSCQTIWDFKNNLTVTEGVANYTIDSAHNTCSKVLYAGWEEETTDCTVYFESSTTEWGNVDKASVVVKSDAKVSISGNTITLGDEVVTATATESTEDITYAFAFWSIDDGAGIYDGLIIYADFTRTVTDLGRAKEFAQYFIENAPLFCDEDGHTDIKTLQYGWGTGNTEYSKAKYTEGAKSILASAKADSLSENVIEKFAASYDYIYGKYGDQLGSCGGNFANRNVTPSSSSRLISINDVSASTWIIAAVAIVGIAAVGVFFIYRKRKEN